MNLSNLISSRFSPRRGRYCEASHVLIMVVKVVFVSIVFDSNHVDYLR